MQQDQGQERRGAPRHRLCLVVHLKTANGKPRTAVVRDASESGAFLLTRGAPVEVGDTVELEVLPVGKSEPLPRLRGHIVRARPWEAGDLWRLGVAVTFEAPLPASIGIEELAAQQAQWV